MRIPFALAIFIFASYNFTITIVFSFLHSYDYYLKVFYLNYLLSLLFQYIYILAAWSF